ncbi:MAG: hypothetical protein L3J91_03885, partial [Thermoplasmata archaeon]|nr:hypothetical protein [Thermoplasmata archaeon]
MRPPMNAVRDPPSGVEELVARDEALLQAGQPTVHVTVVRATGLSFGVGSPQEGHAEQVGRSLGLPCVRRTSGGTGILHQAGDLVWSLVLPRTDRRVGPDFSSAYGRLGA